MKKETLEEAAEKYVDSFECGIAHPRRVCKNAFINGAKRQTKRMHSEEEVKHIVSEALQSALVTVDLEQWFKQFKKK